MRHVLVVLEAGDKCAESFHWEELVEAVEVEEVVVEDRETKSASVEVQVLETPAAVAVSVALLAVPLPVSLFPALRQLRWMDPFLLKNKFQFPGGG